MVAHIRCKTPTAVAAFLFERTFSQEKLLLDCENAVKTLFSSRLEMESLHIEDIAQRLVRHYSHCFAMEEQRILQLRKNIISAFHHTIQNRLHKIELNENTLKHLSPEAILKRGYSITLANGRVVKKASDVQSGVELRTLLSEGEIVSVTK